jgi:hypothetical protein
MRPQFKKYVVLALVFLSWGYFSSRAQAAEADTPMCAAGRLLPR